MVARTKGLAFFKPEPWQKQVLNDQSKVLLLGGSAGGGKSRVAAEKCHAFCLHYPGATVVIMRKVREDMDASTINFMKDTVIDIDNEPRCHFKAREDRIVYAHPNNKKSEILFLGLNTKRQREALKSIGMSGGVDMIWMEEATEFDEADFNYAISRLRGTAAGWTQVILSTNPGGKLHWINRRLILGGVDDSSIAYIPSSASDNPHNASDYESDTLSTLTGLEEKRLAQGLWVDGEGLVIDTWLDDYSSRIGKIKGNVTEEAEYIPHGGPVMWFMDDGYAGEKDKKTGFFTDRSNPRVFLLAQKRRDGRIAIFAEYLDVMKLADIHIEEVKKDSKARGWPGPSFVAHDGAAPALGGDLKRAGYKPKSVRAKIKDGNDELRSWVGKDRNKVRKVIVHPRCKYLRWEMTSYENNDEGFPIDAHNHTVDALTYGVWHMSHGSSQEVSVMAPGIGQEELQEMRTRIQEEIAAARKGLSHARW